MKQLSIILVVKLPSLVVDKDTSAEQPDRRLNVLLIIAENLGPGYGCYGTPLVKTPNVDRRASQGQRLAFNMYPVCSPSCSVFMTEMDQTSKTKKPSGFFC